MIQLKFDSKDSLSQLGLKHFLSKYQIPVAEEKDSAGVCLSYGKTGGGEFNINVVENEITSETHFFKLNELELPLFEDPTKITTPSIKYDSKEVFFGFDVFKEIGCCLTRRLDSVISENPHLAKTPVVDVLEKALFDAITRGYRELRKPFVCKSFWPEGKKFALCLTHDVDEVRKTYQYATHAIKHLLRGNLGGVSTQIKSARAKLRGVEPYWTFEEIMKLEQARGVKSTFYFLQEKGAVELLNPKTWLLLGRRYDFSEPKVRRVIKKLDEGGWEVGLHGSYNSYDNLKLLVSEKEELESIILKDVVGVRQHHLNLKTPETWLQHTKAGLKYDASLGLKNDAGFRWGTCFPFNPITDDGPDFLEVPLSIMDTPLLLRKDAWSACKGILDTAIDYGGLAVVLWHHSILNENEYPGWTSLYEKVIDYCQKNSVWVATAAEIAGWWKKRADVNLTTSLSDSVLSVQTQEGAFLSLLQPKGTKLEFSPKDAEIVDKYDDWLLVKTSQDKFDVGVIKQEASE